MFCLELLKELLCDCFCNTKATAYS